MPAGEWQLEVDLATVKDAIRSPIVYYPGVVSRDEAGTIELAAGLVTDNIAFVVPRFDENKLTLRVSSAPAGAKVAASIIRAAPLMVTAVALNADGVATVKGLVEGRYFAAARAWAGDQASVAFEVVDFVPDMPEVSLALRPAGRITGRIVAQRGGLPPLSAVRVGAAWFHDDVEINPLVPDQVEAAPDGTFRIDGLFGMRRVQVIALPGDWRVMSVLQGRIDVTSGVNVTPGSTVDLTIVLARR